ncbi:hypothetical protein C0Q70_19112 [Pomacea canaliculata]|uniref:Uncharacterized protein n=1 Tax=Pomacea canaliculata TaxID=400727 RepID=A0A2T7NIE7_POMCA|nr:hypothetical protein C0Q70_19112 [Pomacea canaliculata]
MTAAAAVAVHSYTRQQSTTKRDAATWCDDAASFCAASLFDDAPAPEPSRCVGQLASACAGLPETERKPQGQHSRRKELQVPQTTNGGYKRGRDTTPVGFVAPALSCRKPAQGVLKLKVVQGKMNNYERRGLTTPTPIERREDIVVAFRRQD